MQAILYCWMCFIGLADKSVPRQYENVFSGFPRYALMSYSCVNLLLTLRIVEVNMERLKKLRERCEINVLNFYHDILRDLFRNPSLNIL